jgi:hypothetical protein
MTARPIAAAAALLTLLSACGSEAPSGQTMTADEVADKMSEVRIKPGQWEVTSEIVSANAPNLPDQAVRHMLGQKTKILNCITPEEAARPSADFLSAQKDSKCTYRDWSMDNGRMSGTVICEAGSLPGKMVMKMDGHYGAESYDLVMDMESSGLPDGMTMTMKARTTGKHVGECAKGE